MSQIKIGCQLYTWQMSGMKYAGKMTHLSQLIGTTGYSGIESETWMLGGFYENPRALKDLFDASNLQLGGIVLVENWRGQVETDQERENAEKIFTFLEIFTDTHLVLCQMPGEDRSNLSQRQINAVNCVNAVAERAFDRGVTCSFHPNSPPGSVFRCLDDYQFLLEQLNEKVVGFAPDTGHIAMGGMDVAALFSTYLHIIRHIHFKDMDISNEWTAMGEGIINFPEVIHLLLDNGYQGWIMVEEESSFAEKDPDTAAVKNWDYIRKNLLPLL
jgi:inosose dehydratase